MDYYNKYILYKTKYLQLKKQFGGANCPVIGFTQHLGECWSDSILTTLLYSDNISEPIQELFDTHFNNSGNFNPPKSWFDYIHNHDENILLLPPNITRSDFGLFIKEGILLIEQLFNRYRNDKKPKALVRKDYELEYILKLKPTSAVSIPLVRTRSNSIDMSLGCIESLFKIVNINIKEEDIKEYKKESHGGHLMHSFMYINIINYFLIGYYYYIKPELQTISEHNYYILNDIIIPTDNYLYYLNIKKKTDLSVIEKKLKENIYKGVYMSINNSKNQAHSIAFITCNDTDFFYDNNSTNEKIIQPLIKFEWRQYLISKIDKAKSEERNTINLTDLFTLVGREYLTTYEYKVIQLWFIYNDKSSPYSEEIYYNSVKNKEIYEMFYNKLYEL
jgi:hypothetical protein